MNILSAKQHTWKAAVAVLVVLSIGTQLSAHAMNDFSDVTNTNFAYDSVNELRDLGIIGGYADGTFKPDNVINRAELAKIAVKVAKLSGTIDPDKATASGIVFADVSPTAWYYNDVALATQAGIFEGYRDASGALTGKYGPSDAVTRAQSVKVLLLAGGLPVANAPSAPFTDSTSSDWFYRFINAAYGYSIINGYMNASGVLTGTVGPNDMVTRGQVAKITALTLHRVVTNINMNNNANTGSGSTMTGSGSSMTGSGSSMTGTGSTMTGSGNTMTGSGSNMSGTGSTMSGTGSSM
ncbi:MAG: S-layer homology domain-containing protein [Candidatus Gracilibacteria bacterium]